MKWVITRDHISKGEWPSRAGVGNFKGKPADLPVRFKLYDGDGELYYEGRCDEEDFAPLDWAMNDAGCITMKTSRGGKPFEVL